jgi:hypothetical protein
VATLTDRNGNAVTAGSASTVERYEAALDALLTYRTSMEGLWEETVADEPDFAMGHVGRAYLRCTSSEGPWAADAREVLREIGDRGRLTDREQRHVAAATKYAHGDLAGASEELSRLTIDHPRDPLALLVGHQLDFFTGDAANLRDRVGRAIGAWDRDDPRYGYVRGMLAFGLEESGLYPQAEAAGLDAVERDARDVWGHHAVVHTYEMLGRIDDGLAFVDGRRDDWSGDDNIFVVHNTWHEGLYELDRGNLDRVLELYDATIHTAESEPVALDYVDASAMLWRLHLDGVDVGARWDAMADAWSAMDPEPWYSFNDAHATMAYVGAGRLDAARETVDRLAAYAVSPDPSVTNGMMTAEVGLPVCSALLAFGEERYGEVVDLLFPIRRIVQRFGGSNAQRDVVARTMLEAAIRGDDHSLAEALISERLTVRPESGYAKRQLARIS